jgi:hypothetical protein
LPPKVIGNARSTDEITGYFPFHQPKLDEFRTFTFEVTIVWASSHRKIDESHTMGLLLRACRSEKHHKRNDNPMPSIFSIVAPDLPVGESTSGNISYGAEHDYYPISLTAGESYIFDVDGSSLSDSTLALHDGAGTQVAFNDDGGPGLDSRVEYTAPTSDTYYLDVGSYNHSYTGDYTLSTRVDDVADDINTTDSTTPDGWSWGTINSAADQDYYSISLTQGQNYTFDAYSLPGGLSDPTLAVHDNAGTEVAYNDDYGGTLDAHIDYTAPSDGTYYLDVGGYSDHTGSYLLVA